MTDPFDLDRFVAAQAGSYETALDEIRRGARRSHWMWYIFPQIAGLGRSDMARRYAIRSLVEAKAYLAHPILGARLRECLATLQDLIGVTAQAVFGDVDATKLRSSLTLFVEAEGGALFIAVLERWFDGVKDEATLETARQNSKRRLHEGLLVLTGPPLMRPATGGAAARWSRAIRFAAVPGSQHGE